jgi:trehalose-6-phosphatase
MEGLLGIGRKRRLFLDLDGTLAIPYTNPIRPYDHVVALLHRLHADGVDLHLVSFNPSRLSLWVWRMFHRCAGRLQRALGA